MKKLLAIIFLALSIFSVGTVASADFKAPQPFFKSGANWLMNVATEHLGSTGNRIAKIWATDIDATTMSLTGTGTSTITSKYYTVGNIEYASVQNSFQSATTSLCYIANPFGNATTTFSQYISQITVGTSTALTMSLATSTSQYATTTANHLVLDRAVASGAQDFMAFSRMTPDGNVLGPNEILLLKAAGAGVGGYTYTGTCSALFMKP